MTISLEAVAVIELHGGSGDDIIVGNEAGDDSPDNDIMFSGGGSDAVFSQLDPEEYGIKEDTWNLYYIYDEATNTVRFIQTSVSAMIVESYLTDFRLPT
eukprot:Clim_evm3s208 gene=Clim_evmTU3s208